MFKNIYFYHEGFKKAVTAFGTIFNSIQVYRESVTDQRSQSIAVPIGYGPKQKWIARAREAPTLTEGRARVEITLPRMGFEITSVKYDAERKLTQLRQIARGNQTAYVSTPYNIGFSLSIMARNQDDGLQIVEQILPYFCPDFSVSMKELPELGITRDWQLILDDTAYSEDYEGSFGEKTIMLWDLMFTMKINLWGPVANAARIKKVIQNIYADSIGDVTSDTFHETIRTTPIPLSAEYTDRFDFLQEFLGGSGDLTNLILFDSLVRSDASLGLAQQGGHMFVNVSNAMMGTTEGATGEDITLPLTEAKIVTGRVDTDMEVTVATLPTGIAPTGGTDAHTFLAPRYVDANNSIEVRLHVDTASPTGYSLSVHVFDSINGDSVLSNVTVAPHDGSVLRVITVGTQIDAWLNGVIVCSVNETRHGEATAQAFGIWQPNSTDTPVQLTGLRIMEP
jgi:hypothetical protein